MLVITPPKIGTHGAIKQKTKNFTKHYVAGLHRGGTHTDSVAGVPYLLHIVGGCQMLRLAVVIFLAWWLGAQASTSICRSDPVTSVAQQVHEICCDAPCVGSILWGGYVRHGAPLPHFYWQTPTTSDMVNWWSMWDPSTTGIWPAHLVAVVARPSCGAHVNYRWNNSATVIVSVAMMPSLQYFLLWMASSVWTGMVEWWEVTTVAHKAVVFSPCNKTKLLSRRNNFVMASLRSYSNHYIKQLFRSGDNLCRFLLNLAPFSGIIRGFHRLSIISRGGSPTSIVAW